MQGRGNNFYAVILVHLTITPVIYNFRLQKSLKKKSWILIQLMKNIRALFYFKWKHFNSLFLCLILKLNLRLTRSSKPHRLIKYSRGASGLDPCCLFVCTTTEEGTEWQIHMETLWSECECWKCFLFYRNHFHNPDDTERLLWSYASCIWWYRIVI